MERSFAAAPTASVGCARRHRESSPVQSCLVPNVLVTMPFTAAQLERIRRVSPALSVASAEAAAADYSKVDVLYAGAPPRDLTRAPALKWVQLHMAGIYVLHDHPLYTQSALPLTTTSGVHAGTIAEYALTVL